jgi:hypothetical protein
MSKLKQADVLACLAALGQVRLAELSVPQLRRLAEALTQAQRRVLLELVERVGESAPGRAPSAADGPQREQQLHEPRLVHRRRQHVAHRRQ